VAQTTWATSADVLRITGVEVSDQQVSIAGFIIDNYTGRPYSMSWTDPKSGQDIEFNWWEKVGAVDWYYLRMAVSYQTVWMTAQPDIMERIETTEIPTTRQALKIEAQAMIIGPIAKKALGRVSWLRSRALHVRSPFEDLYAASVVPFEADFPWIPVGAWSGYLAGPDF
jgi:hypothetical protein